MKRLMTAALAAALALTAAAIAEDQPASTPPIKELEGVGFAAFDIARGTATKPTEIASAEQLAEYVKDEAARAKITEQVDFAEHKLLVFRWAGSGQDKLTYAVMESFPEQIAFEYRRGLTRDLRQHFKAYVLRKNVTWSVKVAPFGPPRGR